MAPGPEHFAALFEPRGIVVAGAASHPGKFGFVAYHNLRACGYGGALWGTNLSGETVLGEATYPSIAAGPDGPVDLVFVGVPPRATEQVLREAADRGAKAAFHAGAGYAEAGEEGRLLQDELVGLADELDLLLVGPNGQGVVSTPVSMCAQIVAPMPPRGPIAIASQSGGFVSSFGNHARRNGVGISRAVSAGNCAQTGIVDFLEFYADDPETTVALAYVEQALDLDRLAVVAARLPVVVVQGGRTAPGRRATAVHTGSTPGDADLRATGVVVAPTVQHAYEAAATFATQPRPRGPRTVVYSTAGGWGVLAADAVESSELVLLPLPDDLRAAIDEHLPPRWSRANPIDLAGSETRDTIPTLMEVVARHPDVDAVVYLGLGIQSNQAALARASRFYPDHGLERIVEYHERQDARFARSAADVSAATGKPILTATELALTNPENPGPATVRETGRLCYGSAEQAVAALEQLWRYVRHHGGAR